MTIHFFTSNKVFSVSLEISKTKTTHHLEKKYVSDVVYDKNFRKTFC